MGANASGLAWKKKDLWYALPETKFNLTAVAITIQRFIPRLALLPNTFMTIFSNRIRVHHQGLAQPRTLNPMPGTAAWVSAQKF
ncbi:MAG: hypothetical protein K1Y36_09380 [Blastocatellia bacterium]|nr:hypothetical protein [Blastocatellia bacterium]